MILTPPSDPALAVQHETRLRAAVEDNIFALFRSMADVLPGAVLEKTAELSRHHSFPTNPMFKGVWRTNLEPERVDAAIDETIEWFRARGAPYFFWWTGPSARPADLGARLAARGMTPMGQSGGGTPSPGESGAAGMIADLHQDARGCDG